jgi:hypothetical protein
VKRASSIFKVTTWERRVLDILLTEVRRGVRAKKPITITIDAYTAGGGAYVFAGQCESGHSYTVDE